MCKALPGGKRQHIWLDPEPIFCKDADTTVQGEEQTHEKVTAATDRRAPSGRPENLTGHSFVTSVLCDFGQMASSSGSLYPWLWNQR